MWNHRSPKVLVLFMNVKPNVPIEREAERFFIKRYVGVLVTTNPEKRNCEQFRNCPNKLVFCCDCLTCARCRQFPRLHLAQHRWQSQWVHNGNPRFQTATTWQQSILFSSSANIKSPITPLRRVMFAINTTTTSRRVCFNPKVFLCALA